MDLLEALPGCPSPIAHIHFPPVGSPRIFALKAMLRSPCGLAFKWEISSLGKMEVPPLVSLKRVGKGRERGEKGRRTLPGKGRSRPVPGAPYPCRGRSLHAGLLSNGKRRPRYLKGRLSGHPVESFYFMLNLIIIVKIIILRLKEVAMLRSKRGSSRWLCRGWFRYRKGGMLDENAEKRGEGGKTGSPSHDCGPWCGGTGY